jgi:hypothetical protein
MRQERPLAMAALASLERPGRSHRVRKCGRKPNQQSSVDWSEDAEAMAGAGVD